MTIEDLYASDDYVAGLEAGKRISPKTIQKVIPEQRKPITLEEHTWFYIEKTHLIIIHEIYDGEQYLRTDKIYLPKRLLF